jgi:hypothetical protein
MPGAGEHVSYYQNRPVAEPKKFKTGRHSTVGTGPEAQHMDPLLTVIDVRLPRDVDTVERAAE